MRRYEGDHKVLEKAIAKELQPLNPLLCQYFSASQLERLIAAMPLVRPHRGQFLTGREKVRPVYPASKGRTFLLLVGKVAAYRGYSGNGACTEVQAGGLIGEQPLCLGEDRIPTEVAQSALCLEDCFLGVLGQSLLEKAFSDRAVYNARIVQTASTHVRAFGPVFLPESTVIAREGTGGRPKKPAVPVSSPAPQAQEAATAPAPAQALAPALTGRRMLMQVLEGIAGRRAAVEALTQVAKHAIEVHMQPGEELLAQGAAEDFLLVVAAGSLAIHADLELTKWPEYKRKKARLRILVERAESLVGIDKLEPYCIVTLGDAKRVQTPVVTSASKSPVWDFWGSFVYEDEEVIDFKVMGRDSLSGDTFCGFATVPISQFSDEGWSGQVQLAREKRNVYSPDFGANEPAGCLHVTAEWDFDPPELVHTPQEVSLPDVELFTVQERECWGTEIVVLGEPWFRKVLGKAMNKAMYTLELGSFRIIGKEALGGGTNQVITCWKVTRPRVMDLLQMSGRERIFTQECKASTLEKQTVLSRMVEQLLERKQYQDKIARGWAMDLADDSHGGLRSGGLVEKPEQRSLERANAPSDMERFRVDYRGKRAGVAIRNAYNLPAGGWFQGLQPYAVMRFGGSETEFRTMVLDNVGPDVVWACEGSLAYNGEPSLEIEVVDYYDNSVVATAVLTLKDFYRGFEGDVPLTAAKKGSYRAMKINVGVLWEPVQNARGVDVSINGRCSPDRRKP